MYEQIADRKSVLLTSGIFALLTVLMTLKDLGLLAPQQHGPYLVGRGLIVLASITLFVLAVIDRFLELPEEDRLLFQLGRRLGLFRGLEDLESPALRARAETVRTEVKEKFGDDLEQAIRTLAEQYI